MKHKRKFSAALSVKPFRMQIKFDGLSNRLTQWTKVNRRIERAMVFALGVIALSWLGFTIFSNYVFVQRIIAEQVCPLNPDIDGKIHGTQYLTANSTTSVFDCSTLDVTVASDGEVVFQSYKNGDGTLSGDYAGELLVKNLTIEAGGRINANGQGYINIDNDNINGNAQPALGSSAGSGGANGGAGGEGVAASPDPASTPGIVYGSSEDPRLLGGAGSNSGSGGLGGAGGGAIKIIASQTLTNEGLISANGEDGKTDNTGSGGGGAGGSIWIEADSFAGSGMVEANGGVAEVAQYQGGGGGGGRIIMFCNNTNNFTGNAYVGGGTPGSSQPGGQGSLLGPTCRPHAPTILKQFKLDQTTQINVGGATSEGQIILATNLTDPDAGDQLTLQIEVKPLNTEFTNVFTHVQATSSTNPQHCITNISDCGKVTISNLQRSKEYHWQARVKDNKGGFSSWVAFGNNGEGDRDFLLAGAPSSMELVSGNNQTDTVTSNLVNPLKVRVNDSLGFGVPGATVTWTVTDGKTGGSLLNGATSETDENGFAQNTYKLGQKTGINIIQASNVGSPMTFNSYGTPLELDHFVVTGPSVALTNQTFSLQAIAYDRYSNVKTDYVGTVNLTALSAINIENSGQGTLTPSNAQFSQSDSGIISINASYSVKESIKIKVYDNLAYGLTSTIAIVDVLGTCPDADGIIDLSTTWSSTPENQGIFDCRDVPEVKITSSSVLTIQSYSNGDANWTNDFGATVLANKLTIDSGSKITADGAGYVAGVGPGVSGWNGAGGASHGGYSGGEGSAPYGDIYEPITLGSGGYGGGYGTVPGNGGGALKFVVTDTTTINGNLTANGGDMIACGGGRAGGTSGGSILLDIESLTGSGIISTNGGERCQGYGSGGSGGRIAIYYTASSLGLDPAHVQSFGATWSGPGTIYLEQKNVDANRSGQLLIDNNNQDAEKAAAVTGTYSFKQIKATRYGHIEFLGNDSVLKISSGGGMLGDNSKPLIKVSGTLQYSGAGALVIDGVNLGINGKAEGIQDIVVGDTLNSEMTLYAKTWYYNNVNIHTFRDITVSAKGVLSTIAYDNGDGDWTNDYGVNLNLSNLNIEGSGRLTASGLGYGAGRGPGVSGWNGAGGGSHGGYSGGHSSTPYGDIYEPLTMGSGGYGGGYGTNVASGGGAIKLTVSGATIVNGSIEANGGASVPCGGGRAGGGAGGSIYLNLNTLTGGGLITTNGGERCQGYGSGGSGGRIAIYYNTSSLGLNTDHVQAYGASLSGPGTIYFEQKNIDTSHAGQLLIDNNNQNADSAGAVSGNYNFKQVITTRYGHIEFLGQTSVLEISSGAGLVGDNTKPRVTVSGTLRFTGNGILTVDGVDLGLNGKAEGIQDITIGATLNSAVTLYANTWFYNDQNTYNFGTLDVSGKGTLNLVGYDNGDGDWTNDYGVNMTLSNLNIATGGTVTAEGLGYGAGRGPGVSGWNGAGGASHGGYGGGRGSTPYGNVYQPTTFGSGGYGGGYGSGVGAGGGAIKITVTGTANIDGNINVNGQTAPCGGGRVGGASGGSIYLNLNSITGGGLVTANGGERCQGYGSGGSGGRIAIYYNTSTLDLTTAHIQAYGATLSGPGTIYFEQKSVDQIQSGLLFIDNNNQDAESAGVVSGSYNFKQIQTTRYGHVEFLGDDSILEISSGAGLFGDNTKPRVTVSGSLKYTGNGILTVDGVDLGLNGKAEGIQDITIGATLSSGVTLYAHTWFYNDQNGYTFGNVDISANGTLTLVGYDNGDSDWTNDYGVNLNLANLNIASGGKITTQSLGFSPGRGPGATYQGATHGGYTPGRAVLPYDNIYQPTMLGSGGNTDGYGGVARNGGGAIKLTVSGTTTVDGEINASALNEICGGSGGGASGGSLYLNLNTINGGGMLTVNGGNGCGRGGGSGGRIAIYYTDGNFPVESISHVQAFGGNSSGAGTIYLEQAGVDTSHAGLLIIDNNNQNAESAGVTNGNYNFKQVKTSKYGHVEFIGDASVLDISSGAGLVGDSTKPRVTISGTLNYTGVGLLTVDGVDLGLNGKVNGVEDITIGTTLDSGVTLYAHTWFYNDQNGYSFGDLNISNKGTLTLVSYDNGDSDWTNDYGVNMTLNNLNIAASGVITTEGLGYGPGRGLGVSGWNGAGGASHGGYSGGKGSPTYGDLYQPVTFGSGGSGGGYGSGVGSGGGAIKITVTGSTVIDGLINANGQTAVCGGGRVGGASGGSIYLNLATLSGAGTIKANGGERCQGYGSGGSGGRIAVYYEDSTFPLETNVQAYGATLSGPGTIYLENKIANSARHGTLLLNNNGAAGETQSFNSGVYYFDKLIVGNNVSLNLISDSNSVSSPGVIFNISNNFSLGTGAYINGKGLGFISNTGTGKGDTGLTAVDAGGGGAHGGNGGSAESNGVEQPANGGIKYGEQTRPLTLGSGGGNSGEGALGGNGGGAIAILSPNGTININGTIDVSGTDGLTGSPGGGGGAGGSIFIVAQSCTIAGILNANGGNGGDSTVDGGGGGGGRIAILVNGAENQCNNSGSTISVALGTSGAGSVGQVGTYPGILPLPQLETADQYKTNDQQIPVGGSTGEQTVNIKANISVPDASVSNPKQLKAQIEIANTNESFQVQGTTLVSTDEVTYTGGSAASVTAAVTGLNLGETYKWRVRVLDVTQNTIGEWVDYGSNGSSADFVVTSTTSLTATVNKTTVNINEPVSITVNAYDNLNAISGTYNGTIDFTANPGAAISPDLPLSYVFTNPDNGTHTFNNGIIFYSPGVYSITVTDRNNPSLTATSQLITVNEPQPTDTPVPTDTPTPTATNTPLPTDTPVFTPTITNTPLPGVTLPAPTNTVVPTATSIPTNTVAPTSTNTPNHTSVPTSTPAPIVRVTPTVVAVEVVITNVSETFANDKKSIDVCWNTNIATLGYISYGLADGKIYTDITPWDVNYATYHCRNIANLETNTTYIYKITARSQAGKQKEHADDFGVKLDKPVVVEDCITPNQNATDINHNVIVSFKTSYEAVCKVKYGDKQDSLSFFGAPLEETKIKLHQNTLNTNIFSTDLYYEIDCSVAYPDGDKICKKADLVSLCKFADCDTKVNSSPDILSLSSPIVTLPIIGTLVLINTIAYPKWLIYAFLWFKKPKQQKTWGIVYEKPSNKPIAFAVVRLLSLTGVQLQQYVTNFDGKFGFIVDKGDYILVIEHPQYTTFRQKVSIVDDNSSLALDVCLIETGINTTNMLTRLTNWLKAKLDLINTLLVTIGSLFAVFAVIVNPIFFNYLILAIYLIQFVVLILATNKRNWGYVKTSSRERLAGAFIRLYNISEGRQIDVQIADDKGRYRFKVQTGQYLLKADLQGYQFPGMAQKNIYLSKNKEKFVKVSTKNGIINDIITMDKVSRGQQSIANPFS
jgi:hypothetical protein